MVTLTNRRWHSLSAHEVVDLLLSSRSRGLNLSEVERRRARFGPNTLTAKKGKGPLVRFLLQFHQPLIYILIASGIITAFLQEWVDSGVIFAVVLANAVIGFIQESKAVNALAKTMTTEATVLRCGEKQNVPAEELVPGDIVLLQGGDKVSADMRLLEVHNLQIDESVLTGESVSVQKMAGILEYDAGLPDRVNKAHASTLVTYGQGVGIVTATGDNTEVGRISEFISSAEDLATPLTRKIARFSHVLLYVILALAGLTVAVGLLRGQPLFDLVMAAVALAVGAIPEGLPAAVTITLAIGVSRMARRRAIIRRLPAVETLGSTTVICSDKTGTLTENQMTVQEIWAGGLLYEVTGTGYDPAAGTIQDRGVASLALTKCLATGVLCNDSLLTEKDGDWQVHGDPTEGALLVSAVKGDCHPNGLNRDSPRLSVIPFESEHQYMASLHETEGNEMHLICVKGAVEAVLARCDRQLDSLGHAVALQAEPILEQAEQMASRGLRVLAFAEREQAHGPHTHRLTREDVSTGLTFTGLQAMIDPARAEAIQAVRVCREAGIQVKMITGDHAVTAATIAEEVGLGESPVENIWPVRVLTGKQLAALSEEELIEQAEKTHVFARVAPEQKLRLVKALQALGHVVAMTGDGVNDAPVLRQADIGVAMGNTGTEVAKEAADMVLTDDNFSSIEAAVEEGRGVVDNLVKFIVWTLPTNLGEGLVIMAAIFLGVALPILPAQILWINMSTAGFLGLTLAFEPKEPGIMRRRPRNPQSPLLGARLISRILLVSGLLTVASFILFQWELGRGVPLAAARTTAVNVFVVIGLFYLFNCRSLKKSIFQLGFFSNLWVFGGVTAMLLLQVGYTHLPVMNRLFQSAPIGAASWAGITAAGTITYLVVEVEKRLRSVQLG